METVVLTALGIVLGGVITIATAIAVEYLRKPRLHIQLGKSFEMHYQGDRPVDYMKALNLDVHNKQLPLPARWMSRNPAIQCHGSISFHHLDGQNIFGRTMDLRWSGPRTCSDCFDSQ